MNVCIADALSNAFGKTADMWIDSFKSTTIFYYVENKDEHIQQHEKIIPSLRRGWCVWSGGGAVYPNKYSQQAVWTLKAAV